MRYRRRISLSRIVVFLLGMPVFSASQTTSSGQTEPAASTSVASSGIQPETSHDFRFSIERITKDGFYVFIPEHWGELHLQFENGRKTPWEADCATYFEDQTALQFGRRIWLPAQSRLNISHPILIPKIVDPTARSVNLHSLVVDRSASNDVLVRNDSGQLLHDETMLLMRTPRNTGIIASSRQGESVPAEVLDLIVANRVHQHLNNKVVALSETFLPADENLLNYLDHLVIAENRLADDAAALSAVRRWLHTGGRLWIMLDRVDPRILERLLGDDFRGRVVDHVDLTTVRIDRAPTLAMPEGEIGQTIEYDSPVKMVRMLAPDMQVSDMVNGWPASLTRSYGEGRLLVTTLGPRGWMKPKIVENKNDQANNPLLTSEYLPDAHMQDLANFILAKRESELLSPTFRESMAQEYIAYSIPAWRLIIGMEFVFIVALAGLGYGLFRKGLQEHFGWSASLIGLLFGVLFILVGWSYRHHIPGTIASVQIAQAIDGTDDVRTQGTIVAYHPEGSPAKIRTENGSCTQPDMTASAFVNRRIVTTDLGQTVWEGEAQTVGLRVYPMTASQASPRRISAKCTFDSSGVVGFLSGQVPAGSDAMLATRQGRLGVTLHRDYSFTARADDVFEADQYLDASFLGDEQSRRRRLLESLLDRHTRNDFPVRPQLVVWPDRWENGFWFGDGLVERGASVLLVPLELNRPPNGKDFVIPAPLISFQSRLSPDGSPQSAIWNDRREEWQERSSPGLTWLNFQIPRELVPLTVSRARVRIKVTGPMGRLELLGIKRGQVVGVATTVDPVGTLNFDIDDSDILTVSESGGISLGLNVGDSSRLEPTKTNAGGVGATKTKATSNINTGTKVNSWKIESLSLQIWARTTDLTDQE